jgi:hypothetical protein
MTTKLAIKASVIKTVGINGALLYVFSVVVIAVLHS